MLAVSRFATALLATTLAACRPDPPAPASFSPVATPISGASLDAGAPQGARSILDATPEELRGGHLWLTYLGPQKSPVQTVGFRSALEAEIGVEELAPLRRERSTYGNDYWLRTDHEIPVSPAELARMVATARDIVAELGPPGDLRRLSGTIAVRKAGRIVGSEFILGASAKMGGILFYQRLFDAIEPSNEVARDAVACQRLDVGWYHEADVARCIRSRE